MRIYSFTNCKQTLPHEGKGRAGFYNDFWSQQLLEPECASFVYLIAAMTPRGVRTYVGWTFDPARRLQQHNAGTGAKATRGYQWQLLYVEKFLKREAAMSREWSLKRDRRFRRCVSLTYVPASP